MTETPAGALRVLLVEDNAGDARLVIERFRDAGAQPANVDHTLRLADALSRLDETDYDVVLLDLSLPDAHGLVTVQRIRASAPHVPIVVLSGIGDERGAIEAVHEGAQDYLVKSQIDDAALLRAVQYAIGRHKRMHRIAYYDALTSLPNRALFRDRLASTLARRSRHDDKAALLFIDLDGFKEVNDTFGHEGGDRVLGIAARRMRESVRASEMVARYGGDEFTVLLPSLPRYHDALLVADKLRARLLEPYAVGDRTIAIGASIGIALSPLDGSEADQLVHSADAAMYRAKRRRNGIVLATPLEPPEPENLSS